MVLPPLGPLPPVVLTDPNPSVLDINHTRLSSGIIGLAEKCQPTTRSVSHDAESSPCEPENVPPSPAAALGQLLTGGHPLTQAVKETCGEG